MPAAEPAVVMVLTTEADGEKAEALARCLLERRLVACVSTTPIRSHYRWQGVVERAEEVQLLLKTNRHRLQALEEAVRELHSYDTPEWIVWPAHSSGTYGPWVQAQLGPAGPGPSGP